MAALVRTATTETCFLPRTTRPYTAPLAACADGPLPGSASAAPHKFLTSPGPGLPVTAVLGEVGDGGGVEGGGGVPGVVPGAQDCVGVGLGGGVVDDEETVVVVDEVLDA